MATYTSTGNGDWNAAATWGGGGWPQNAADLAIIGHTVNYNVVSTAELGTGASDAITLNASGILTFSVAMSTKLTIGHYDIQINNGGELRVGASGAVIPKAYTAQLIWNTTADNAKGFDIAAGGKLIAYGDLDYFGSDYDTVLTSDNVIAIAGLSRAAACVVTWTAHGLITGDVVTLSGITQDGAGQWPTLNGTWPIIKLTADTFSVAVNTSAYTNAYVPATDPGVQQAIAIPAATNPITLTVAGNFTSDGNAEAISAMTRAADCSITWALHGLVAGDKFTIADIAQADWTALNGVQTVKAVTDVNTITIETDTSGYAADYLNTDPGTYTRSKWKVGQELIVHKGGAYTSYINDFCRLAITSVTANAGNTDIATTVTERPAALTCLVGADVLHVTRNVMLYKLSYNDNLGQFNTNRPKLINANAVGTSNININNAMFGGWYQVINGYAMQFNGVIRNSCNVLINDYMSNVGGLLISNNYLAQNTYLSNISAHIAAASYGLWSGSCIYMTGNIFGVNIFINSFAGIILEGHIYSCGTAITSVMNGICKGNIGFNAAGIPMANTTDFKFFILKGKHIIVGGLTPTSPVFSGRNAINIPVRFCFEHYQQVANAHYIADAFGDITKTAADGTGDNPSLRSGGSANIIEVDAQTNCSATAYLEVFNIRLWAEASVSKTYRFYLQTDYADLDKDELVLYEEHLDEGSGGHLATSNTSGAGTFTTRANAADWSQYIEITVNPAQAGYVNLYLRLLIDENTKKVWVDPMVVITGGSSVTVTPYWSYGEVQLDIDPVASGGGQGARSHNIGIGVN